MDRLVEKSESRRRAAIGIVGAMVLAAIVGTQPAAAQSSTDRSNAGVFIDTRQLANSSGRQRAEALLQRAGRRGQVRVIVGLNVALRDEDELSDAEQASQARALQNVQEGVARRGVIPPGQVKRFNTIPYMSVFVTRAQLQRLLNDPQVVSIEEDVPQRPLQRAPDSPELGDSVPLIRANTVWLEGFTGAGQVVAVLDAGIDDTHPMLSNKLVAGLCRSTTSAEFDSQSVCPRGVASSNALRSGRPCPDAVAGCEHGTHVASIAVGNSAELKGVAPAAKLISAQVFSRFDADSGFCDGVSDCALTFSTDQVSALERILQLRNQFNIAAANMSLGGGASATHCDADNTARSEIINKLFRRGIATVLASGEGLDGQISSPACIKNAVAVGSTTKSDAVSSFSNHAMLVDLMAPGSNINAANRGGGFGILSGTSMATPHVAGAYALLKDARPTATVNDILTALQATGVPVSRAGITKPRIDVFGGLNRLEQQLPAIPAQIVTHHDTIPIYGNRPTIRAVASGSWHSASTWNLGRLPNANDAVHIPLGLHVRGGGAAINILDLVAEGALTLDSNFNMSVRTLTVLPTGHLMLLKAGTITIRNIPINTQFDPFQFGNGLLVIDGKLTIDTPDYRDIRAEVSAEILAGHSTIKFASVPQNWKAGDTLVIPDTRQPVVPADMLASNRHVERVTIQAVTGNTVTLTAPVRYDHLGWHNQAGAVEELFDIGNLSQPIVIRSEIDPRTQAGTPGHVLMLRHADIEITGLSTVQMGRTRTAEPLNNTVKSGSTVTHVGTNQIGRYALHFHHVLGRENNGKPHQFRANYVSIDGSPKWGIAVHGSHYGDVRNNFVFDAAGAGLVTEWPTDYGNDFSSSLVIGYRDGSGQRITDRSSRNLFGGDHWHGRVGLGLSSGMNKLTDIHIYNVSDGIGMASHGTTQLWWPKVRGVHVPRYNASTGVTWTYNKKNLGPDGSMQYPFVFDTSGVKVWGSWRGIEVWTVNSYPGRETMFPRLSIIHTRHPTDFEDQRETTTYNWKWRGDFSKVRRPIDGGDQNTYAIRFKDAYEFGHTHFNADVRGYDVMYRMVVPDSYSKFVGGRAEVATVVYQPYGQRNSIAKEGWTGTWQDVEYVPVEGVRLRFIDGWYPKYDIDLWLGKNEKPEGGFLARSRYEILPWIDGRNLLAYHWWQSATYKRLPAITAPDFYGDFPPGVYRNADLIKLGTPIFGAVIPANAEKLPEFPNFFVSDASTSPAPVTTNSHASRPVLKSVQVPNALHRGAACRAGCLHH